MNTHQIDQLVGGTPCLCGVQGTWHLQCYAGKTQAQVDAAYRRVYAKIRRRLKAERAEVSKRSY